MWWIPLVAAILLAVIIGIGQWLWNRRFDTQTDNYHKQFVRLVNQLTNITVEANRLMEVAPRIKDRRSLDYYEGSLNLMENLLTTVKAIPQFSSNVELVHSAAFLAKDCEERIGRTRKLFKRALKGGGNAGIQLESLSQTDQPRGCYFCSRPFFALSFRRVRVKIEGQSVVAWGCEPCRRMLKKKRKVKVLYFVKDGKQVHWQDLPEYDPLRDFRTVEDRLRPREPTGLKLVYSRAEQTDNNRFDDQ